METSERRNIGREVRDSKREGEGERERKRVKE